MLRQCSLSQSIKGTSGSRILAHLAVPVGFTHFQNAVRDQPEFVIREGCHRFGDFFDRAHNRNCMLLAPKINIQEGKPEGISRNGRYGRGGFIWNGRRQAKGWPLDSKGLQQLSLQPNRLFPFPLLHNKRLRGGSGSVEAVSEGGKRGGLS